MDAYIVDRPQFVPALESGSNGVDYLGLRQVNMRHVASLFPGISGATTELRPYALMTWAAWAYAREFERTGLKEVEYAHWKRFTEKVEVLFVWGHQLNYYRGIGTGANQKDPGAGAAARPLSFADWSRKPSYLAAQSYGPSLRNDGGLGFLQLSGRARILTTTAAGQELAEEVDRRLSKIEGYRQLISLEKHRATPALAKALYPAWRLGMTTAKERSIFREALQRAEGLDGWLTRRGIAISMILSALRENDAPATAHELRIRLGWAPDYWAGAPQERTPEIRVAIARWQVLQVRQAQRLALEVVLAWVEEQLIRGLSTTDALVDAALKVLGGATQATSWLIEALQRRTPGFGRRHGNTIVDEVARLERMLKTSPRNAVLRHALDLLFRTAGATRRLAADSAAAPLLDNGHSARISLLCWRQFVDNCGQLPVRLVLARILENYIISQHLSVAVQRHDEDNSKLRFTIEERGLTSLLDSNDEIGRPRTTPDRLDAMLSLMTECGLVVAMAPAEQAGGEWSYRATHST